MLKKIDYIKKYLILWIAFILGAVHLLNVSGIFVLSTPDIRIFHLMLMLSLLFLDFPSLKKLENNIIDNIFRLILVILSLSTGIHMIFSWEEIAMSGGDTTSLDIFSGIVILFLILEATRRGIGLLLSIICLIFFTYPFYSQYLGGVFYSKGYSLERMSEFLTTTSQGVYGIPLGVSASYIILFSIFGSFLSQFGAGEFFFKLATRITKNMHAASAKTAVIFSTLLGMISGSAAGNVAVTGTLTIPMMKKEGYKNYQAGAIEAVISTGGQIMPPVMGAAAFIMAEIIGKPYTEIMKAGIVPALLFFISTFFVVHFQAKKNGLKPLKYKDDGEKISTILFNGLQYLIPFILLIVFMLNGYSPFKACFFSILILLVLNVVWTRKVSLKFFENLSFAIINGTKNIVPIAIACGAAGIIAGTLGITGLGSKISGLILTWSFGIPFWALFMTMVVAIILGMGLPTTAAYLILATVVAPALSDIGVPMLTAHMFVFFYGCVSTITPPVALASYVAAGIAGAKINEVGWTAFAYGLTCYILPFMFFFGPALLLNDTLEMILIAIPTSIIGVFCISLFVIGYYKEKLNLLNRILFFISGILLLKPGYYTDIFGIIILFFFFVFNNKNLIKSSFRRYI